jgi:hypothetical protein
VDGTVFLANASSTNAFFLEPDNVWEINITNNNKYNYVNRFIQIDLFDASTSHAANKFFSGLNWDTEIAASAALTRFRIIDEDAITPLDVYHYPAGSNVKTFNPTTLATITVKTRLLAFIRIPYFPAYTTKKLFLVKFPNNALVTSGAYAGLFSKLIREAL